LVIAAILYRMREGCRWRALSALFMPYGKIYYWWRKWLASGVIDRAFQVLIAGESTDEVHGDSTCIKVHKSANSQTESAEEQMVGTSKGGKNTKIHGLVNEAGMPIRLFLSPGNDHDSKHAGKLLEGIEIGVAVFDKAYDTNPIRELICAKGAQACIPSKSNRKVPIPHDRETYKRRHFVENFFQRIKEHRAIATRYEKLSSTFAGLVTLAAIIDWIRFGF
jgi:transposase